MNQTDHLANVIATLLVDNEPTTIVNTRWFKELLTQYRNLTTGGKDE